MSTVAHFFIIIVAQKFVITWLTFSLTFTRRSDDDGMFQRTFRVNRTIRRHDDVIIFFHMNPSLLRPVLILNIYIRHDFYGFLLCHPNFFQKMPAFYFYKII